MTQNELREFDAWIAENVMNLKPCGYVDHVLEGNKFCYKFDKLFVPKLENGKIVGISEFHPTTDPAAAMEVLKKCLDETIVVLGGYSESKFCVSQINGRRLSAEAKTLELAICLFAKKLFTK